MWCWSINSFPSSQGWKCFMTCSLTLPHCLLYHKFKQYNIIDRNIILIRLKVWFLSLVIRWILHLLKLWKSKVQRHFGYPLYSVVTSRLFPFAPVKIPEVLRWAWRCSDDISAMCDLWKNLMKSTCLIYERFYGQITHFVHTRDFWSTRIYVSPVLFQNYKDSLNANEISTQARSGEIKNRGNPGI